MRPVDPKQTRKAKRAIEALKAHASGAEAASPFSSWESEFIEGVGERLETFGSAFADYGKGAPENALSRLQEQKVKELAKKVQAASRRAAKGEMPAVKGAQADARAVTPPRRGGLQRRNRVSRTIPLADEQ